MTHDPGQSWLYILGVGTTKQYWGATGILEWHSGKEKDEVKTIRG